MHWRTIKKSTPWEDMQWDQYDPFLQYVFIVWPSQHFKLLMGDLLLFCVQDSRRFDFIWKIFRLCRSSSCKVCKYVCGSSYKKVAKLKFAFFSLHFCISEHKSTSNLTLCTIYFQLLLWRYSLFIMQKMSQRLVWSFYDQRLFVSMPVVRVRSL